MNELYTMPITDYEDDSIVIVDMANLDDEMFTDDKYKKAMIYIRNCGIEVVMNFDNCTYEDKSEYLKLFMWDDVEIDNLDLGTTWVKIMHTVKGKTADVASIMDDTEIINFINDNTDAINEVLLFINSLPVLALYFSEDPFRREAVNTFEENDAIPVSLVNFHRVTACSHIIHIIGYENLQRYSNILDDDNVDQLRNINNTLPFTSLYRVISTYSEQE